VWHPQRSTIRRVIGTAVARSSSEHGICDVAVIGGGPAGSTCAYLLSQSGAEVSLWESNQTPAPRFHEIAAPAAQPFLRRLGLDPLVEQLATRCLGILRQWNGVTLQTHVFGTPALILDRLAFDTLCRERARDVGVRWINDCVQFADRRAGEWRLCGQRSRGRSRLLIDASGRSSFIARRFGRALATGEPTLAIGLSYATNGPANQMLRVERVTTGWWYFVDRDGTTDAVWVVPRHALAGRRPQDMLGDALGTSHWANATRECRSTWSQPRVMDATPRAHVAAGDHWLAIGDAAAAYDPISSQGLTNSLSTAWFAARALQDYDDGNPSALDVYAAAVYLTWERTLSEQYEIYGRP